MADHSKETFMKNKTKHTNNYPKQSQQKYTERKCQSSASLYEILSDWTFSASSLPDQSSELPVRALFGPEVCWSPLCHTLSMADIKDVKVKNAVLVLSELWLLSLLYFILHHAMAHCKYLLRKGPGLIHIWLLCLAQSCILIAAKTSNGNFLFKITSGE